MVRPPAAPWSCALMLVLSTNVPIRTQYRGGAEKDDNECLHDLSRTVRVSLIGVILSMVALPGTHDAGKMK